jgi:hypothetical protein
VNYNNSKGGPCPLKKGKITDVITPKKLQFTRVTPKNNEDLVGALHVDLVRALAQLGIVIQNTYTIARSLAADGWVKTKQIKKDTQ